MATILISNKKKNIGYRLKPDANKIIIGRGEDCTISLPDAESLSRQHCCICAVKDGYTIEDLGSTNGVYADGVKITEPTLLRENTVYILGDVQITANGLTPPPQEEKEESPTAPQKKNTPPAPPKKERTGKKAKKLNTQKAPPLGNTRLRLMLEQLNKPHVSIIHILIVLIIAFYAGLALYSWVQHGNPLPIFIQ